MDRRTATEGLRYYLHDHSAGFRFVLIGALEGPDVRELGQCRQTASSSSRGGGFIVDVSALVSADRGGIALLQRWHEDGARFIAKTAHGLRLVRSVTGEAGTIPDAQPATGFFSSLRSVFKVEIISRICPRMSP